MTTGPRFAKLCHLGGAGVFLGHHGLFLYVSLYPSHKHRIQRQQRESPAEIPDALRWSQRKTTSLCLKLGYTFQMAMDNREADGN